MSSENTSISQIDTLPAETQEHFKKICKHFGLPDGTHPTQKQQQDYLRHTVNEEKKSGEFSAELWQKTKQR
jgi:hypothetical protein